MFYPTTSPQPYLVHLFRLHPNRFLLVFVPIPVSTFQPHLLAHKITPAAISPEVAAIGLLYLLKYNVAEPGHSAEVKLLE